MTEFERDFVSNTINKYINIAIRFAGMHLAIQARPNAQSALIFAPQSHIPGPLGSLTEREFSELCKILVCNFGLDGQTSFNSSEIYENIYIHPNAITKDVRYHAIYLPRKNGIRELYISMDLTKEDRGLLEKHSEYIDSLSHGVP